MPRLTNDAFINNILGQAVPMDVVKLPGIRLHLVDYLNMGCAPGLDRILWDTAADNGVRNVYIAVLKPGSGMPAAEETSKVKWLADEYGVSITLVAVHCIDGERSCPVHKARDDLIVLLVRSMVPASVDCVVHTMDKNALNAQRDGPSVNAALALRLQFTHGTILGTDDPDTIMHHDELDEDDIAFDLECLAFYRGDMRSRHVRANVLNCSISAAIPVHDGERFTDLGCPGRTYPLSEGLIALWQQQVCC